MSAVERLEKLDVYVESLRAKKTAGTLDQAEYDARRKVATDATMKEVEALSAPEPEDRKPKKQRRLGDGSAVKEEKPARRAPKESWGPFEDEPLQTYKDMETGRQMMALFNTYTEEGGWSRTARATRQGGTGSMPKDEPAKWKLNWEYEKGSGDDKEVACLRAKVLASPTEEGHTCGIFMKVGGLPREPRLTR